MYFMQYLMLLNFVASEKNMTQNKFSFFIAKE